MVRFYDLSEQAWKHSGDLYILMNVQSLHDGRPHPIHRFTKTILWRFFESRDAAQQFKFRRLANDAYQGHMSVLRDENGDLFSRGAGCRPDQYTEHHYRIFRSAAKDSDDIEDLLRNPRSVSAFAEPSKAIDVLLGQ